MQTFSQKHPREPRALHDQDHEISTHSCMMEGKLQIYLSTESTMLHRRKDLSVQQGFQEK